jgi:hypothetical protein
MLDLIMAVNRGKSIVDRTDAHFILAVHLARRDWRWLGLRRRCSYCGRNYPCPAREGALAHLSDAD